MQDAQIKSALLKSSSVTRRARLLELRGRQVQVDEKTECVGCHRRIGTAAFTALPNGEVAHIGCAPEKPIADEGNAGSAPAPASATATTPSEGASSGGGGVGERCQIVWEPPLEGEIIIKRTEPRELGILTHTSEGSGEADWNKFLEGHGQDAAFRATPKDAAFRATPKEG